MTVGAARSRDPLSQSALRAQRDLLNGINLMLLVQSPFEKIFPFPSDPNHFTVVRIPAQTEGRFAIVTNVGRGCDGRRWATDERATLWTAKSCGPDASMVGVKLVMMLRITPATVTTKPDHRGEREISC
jgi:hypothetical protein